VKMIIKVFSNESSLCDKEKIFLLFLSNRRHALSQLIKLVNICLTTTITTDCINSIV